MIFIFYQTLIETNIFSILSSFFFNLYLNLIQFLILTNTLYFIGLLGIIYNNRNFLLTMLFIEVMYIAIFSYILASSMLLNLQIGHVYALSILIIAACESAVGLGILLLLFKNTNTINFENFNELRG